MNAFKNDSNRFFLLSYLTQNSEISIIQNKQQLTAELHFFPEMKRKTIFTEECTELFTLLIKASTVCNKMRMILSMFKDPWFIF